jgi:Fe-Mn family superoxide dismutase
MKALLKELSFHVGGYRLHTRFWENLAPSGKGGGGVPKGELAKAIDAKYGSFDRVKKEFVQAASSTEGSGWAALTYLPEDEPASPHAARETQRQCDIGVQYPHGLGVWEHAYYLDYKKDRAMFIESFWTIVNWGEVNKRLISFLKK